ncbi:MAG: alpha/beta hydrolase [Caulobacteraceae bacterium]|nr:alpha/beta hydrolase [Caulobacteraceae bacterium]
MEEIVFAGHSGLKIAADVAGPAGGPAVVLMHGGGQTRYSWKKGLETLAARGYRTYSLDSRGHGASEWAADADYSLDAQVADLVAVLAQLPARPALIGASMGGVTALAAVGEHRVQARSLVLVDVTPKIDESGAQRIGAFMRANPDGFGSLEEVADAVSAYNPHRPRPGDVSGLRRNLREADGRLYWHWDPNFISSDRRLDPKAFQARLEAATRGVAIPTLLIRGASSDVVGKTEVEHFQALLPAAEYVDVQGAGHMVAGDRNDHFNSAIVEFLVRTDAARGVVA